MTDDRSNALWNAKAAEWAAHTGDEGDANRRFNSDPVLWKMLGPVEGRAVLDAGCGAGYLAVALARRGAQVTAIDLAEAMVATTAARALAAGVSISARVDSASVLATVADAAVNAIVANYVLMDLSDLDGAARAFRRVLRPGGVAVVIINHPCFSPPPERLSESVVRYTWPFSYFESHRLEQSWGRFTTPFVYNHRSLSTYWRAFTGAGLVVEDFDEPIVSAPAPAGCSGAMMTKYRMTPYSVAFRLITPS